jgi:hypothetical protein
MLTTRRHIKPWLGNAAALLLVKDPVERCAMTARNGTLPCCTAASSNRMWLAPLQRWWSGVEKMAAHGYPVLPEHALAQGVPCLDYTAIMDEAHMRVGNCMHVPTIGSWSF